MADGLLHLGAMAVLTGVVYLNLDKAVAQPAEDAKEIEALREAVRVWSKTYDQEYSYIPTDSERPRPSRSYDSGKAYFLLRFAKIPEAKYFLWYQRWIYNTYNFIFHPTTTMICDGRHFIIVGALTILSAVCFFCQVGGPVINAKHYLFGDHTLFYVYLATVALTLIFARLSRRLATLKVRLDIMMSDLSREKQHEDDKVRLSMRDTAQISSSTVVTDANPS